jgi:thiol-disulfide isomerase/thioredoxin
MLLRTLLTAVAVLAIPAAALGQSLKVGDKAPPIVAEKWVKGEAVKGLEHGRVYVVEFWATWCGPCIKGIPHLTELQKRYKDKGVTVIGMTAEDPNNTLAAVEKFVKGKGEEMAYTVAFDDHRKTDHAYMEAAGRNSIPSAFLINQDGKIAWIGHPADGLDDAIAKLNPKATPKAATSLASGGSPEGDAIIQEIQASEEQKKYPAAIAAVDRLLKLNPTAYGDWSAKKVELFVTGVRNTTAAESYAKDVVTKTYKDNPKVLGAVASKIASIDAASPKLVDLAADAAQRAVELTHDADADALQALAAVQARKGDAIKSVETQTKAVALITDPAKRTQAQALINTYKKAAPKK